MDFSGGVKHWDKCKLRTALEWVVFTSSSQVRLIRVRLVLVNLNPINNTYIPTNRSNRFSDFLRLNRLGRFGKLIKSIFLKFCKREFQFFSDFQNFFGFLEFREK